MKKILMLLLAATLVFTACGKEEEKKVDEPTEEVEEEKEEKKSADGKWNVDENGALDVSEYEFNDRDQIIIDGEKYADDSEVFTSTTKIGSVDVALPIELAELTSAGYTIKEDDPEMEVAHRYGLSSVRLTSDEDYSLVASVYNVSGETVALKDTMVDMLSFSRRNNDDLDIASDVEFPMGITFGSTMNDVTAAYGEPTKAIVTGLDAYSVAFDYESANGYNVKYTFYKGMLKSATISD